MDLIYPHLPRATVERDRGKVEGRIKAAKFSVGKSLDSFDFTAIPP